LKICHFTSLHSRQDTRVFIKQCSSFASIGWEVYLIVADGLGDEDREGVSIIDIGRRKRFPFRFITTNRDIYKRALELKADIYVYHDPELSIQAVQLVNKGCRVYYDAHEDSPRQYLTNYRGLKVVGKIIAKLIELLENRSAKHIAGLFTATEGIKERYDCLNSSVLVVKNYPIKNELDNNVAWHERKNQLCYIGGLRNTRGIDEIITASSKNKLPLMLAGSWQPLSYEHDLRKKEGWRYTEYLGFLDRSGVKTLLSESRVGLLTLHKTPNHLHSLPIKLFEYMTAGLPIVASDIDKWKDIIEQSGCGICVDPMDVDAIAEAINTIMSNPEMAERMSRNGKISVRQNYSWSNEFENLIEFLSS